jgi:hypothetical protein
MRMFKVQCSGFNVPTRPRTLNLQPVAVGTALAGGPPHGSGRAELPHPALALGNNAKAHQRMRMITPLTPSPPCCLTYPLKRAGHAAPALSPGHVTLGQIPLGQSPSLHCLLGLRPGLVRRLLGYYGTVRLPVPVHHRGYVLRLSDAVCTSLSHRQTRDLPASAQGACVHAQGLRPRRVQRHLAIATPPVLPSA